jgi:hypothetical protein
MLLFQICMHGLQDIKKYKKNRTKPQQTSSSYDAFTTCSFEKTADSEQIHAACHSHGKKKLSKSVDEERKSANQCVLVLNLCDDHTLAAQLPEGQQIVHMALDLHMCVCV